MIKWDSYNVYAMVVDRLVQKTYDLMRANKLHFDMFPPTTKGEHYCNIIAQVGRLRHDSSSGPGRWQAIRHGRHGLVAWGW